MTSGSFSMLILSKLKITRPKVRISNISKNRKYCYFWNQISKTFLEIIYSKKKRKIGHPNTGDKTSTNSIIEMLGHVRQRINKLLAILSLIPRRIWLMSALSLSIIRCARPIAFIFDKIPLHPILRKLNYISKWF